MRANPPQSFRLKFSLNFSPYATFYTYIKSPQIVRTPILLRIAINKVLPKNSLEALPHRRYKNRPHSPLFYSTPLVRTISKILRFLSGHSSKFIEAYGGNGVKRFKTG